MDKEVIKETENVIFYKNKFGGIDFKIKNKNPNDIITPIK